MVNLVTDSNYFHFWFENISIKHKNKTITVLKRFESFLNLQGFEGELNFDQFYGSRNNSDRFLPIQKSFIDKFFLYLLDDCGASKFVLYNSIVSLKGFFKFLYETELIITNPMQDYPNPYYHRPVKNTALTKEECIDIMYFALKKDPFYRYEFTLFWFMIVTGLRNSEIRMLRRSKVNTASKIVLVNEGQKSAGRVAYITPSLATEIQRFTQHPSYLVNEMSGIEFLFGRSGEAHSPYSFSKIIRELCAGAGITRRVTPHDIRRTSGYLMQAGGMHIVEVQKQLGHKLLATTLRYTPPLLELAEILLSVEID